MQSGCALALLMGSEGLRSSALHRGARVPGLCDSALIGQGIHLLRWRDSGNLDGAEIARRRDLPGHPVIAVIQSDIVTGEHRGSEPSPRSWKRRSSKQRRNSLKMPLIPPKQLLLKRGQARQGLMTVREDASEGYIRLKFGPFFRAVWPTMPQLKINRVYRNRRPVLSSPPAASFRGQI